MELGSGVTVNAGAGAARFGPLGSSFDRALDLATLADFVFGFCFPALWLESLRATALDLVDCWKDDGNDDGDETGLAVASERAVRTEARITAAGRGI